MSELCGRELCQSRLFNLHARLDDNYKILLENVKSLLTILVIAFQNYVGLSICKHDYNPCNESARSSTLPSGVVTRFGFPVGSLVFPALLLVLR